MLESVIKWYQRRISRACLSHERIKDYLTGNDHKSLYLSGWTVRNGPASLVDCHGLVGSQDMFLDRLNLINFFNSEPIFQGLNLKSYLLDGELSLIIAQP